MVAPGWCDGSRLGVACDTEKCVNSEIVSRVGLVVSPRRRVAR
jgi:hypothetical protein